MGTSTTSFGSSRREGHDASAFYARRLATASEDLTTKPYDGPPVESALYAKSSEHMQELPNDSVALMVTSPPYHVGKEYDTDESFEDYLSLCERVMTDVYRVLEPGGRAAVNVAGLGRKPYLPLPDIYAEMMHDIGFFARGEIIWLKARGSSGSCAWGTFQSAKNPVLRDVHEYIQVFSKGRFGRAKDGTSTISKEDFMAWTLSAWEFPSVSAKRVGHPAPFPVELPRRLIQLYTYVDDVVLDPFVGAGSTCIAADESGRRHVGYDISAEYIELAATRIENARKQRKAAS